MGVDKSKIAESGNALFLILIAVALFAALAYAVTRSDRGSGGIGKEQALLYASQITQAGAMMKQAYTRIVLMGTSAHNIRCSATTPGADCGAGSANAGHDDLCTTGTDCLFSPTGFGVSVPQMPQPAYDFSRYAFYLATRFSGPTSYNGFYLDTDNVCCSDSGAEIAMPGAGTSTTDDVMVVGPLSQTVCTALNTGLGINGIPDGSVWAYTNDVSAAVNGKESFCADIKNAHGLGYGYAYFQLLYAR